MSTLCMRKLSRSTTQETLRSMLLFAKDFVGAEFVTTDAPEDTGYLTAIARFRSASAAQEAQSSLNGKQMNPDKLNETPIIVEIHRLASGGLNSRKNNFDLAEHRANSSSSTTSTNPSRQAPKYNGTFPSIDRVSPPNGVNGFGNGHSKDKSDGIPPRSNFFSPQSPIDQRPRVSGKAVIGEDGADEEPSELLKDPLGYANGDIARRSTTSSLPPSRFGPLSLSTTNSASPLPSFTSPRSGAGPLQSPNGPLSPTGMGPNSPYHVPNQHFARHTYPPVNPADQNPPCNTLYVGNLPVDASEDELKSLFSKQRGYKRLCFRTKHNGPMCFVEFEDISFATKALNELYGHPLHNSVKGGIRLSFSKNPLGVRTGQPGAMGPSSPMSPSSGAGGTPLMNGLGPFSTASGPPPGLSAPPGLGNSQAHYAPPHATMNGMNGMMSPTSGMGFPMSDPAMGVNGMRGPPATTGAWPGQGGGGYGDYMSGR